MAQKVETVGCATVNCSEFRCKHTSQRTAPSPSLRKEESFPQKQCLKYVEYENYLSALVKRVRPTALRSNLDKSAFGDYLKMGIGSPNAAIFPLVEADFKLRDGSVVHVDRELMQQTLQYFASGGYPALLEWLVEFQCKVHAPPTLDPQHPGHFDVVVTNGCAEGILLAGQMLLNEGDSILIEDATYATTFNVWGSIGAKPVPIKIDKDGMIAEDLERVLTSWSDVHPGCRKPRVLYAVTSGGNPTGINWSLERKRAAYDLARAHDLLVLEDDAYYFLQFNRPLVPSFLSMDVDGRVVRFDTFSKTIAPGLRAAMVSGPSPLMRKIIAMKDFGSANLSGLTQAMLLQLLRHWGHDGYLRHVDSVMEFNAQKASVAVACAKRHLAGLAEWNNPSGGMFLWLRILGIKDSRVIASKALERHLVLVAGIHFVAGSQESPYLRINYSTVSEDECDKAFKILADVIKEDQKK